MKGKFLATLVLVTLTMMLVGVANADQVTIGASVSNDLVIFQNIGGTTSLGFAGSTSVGNTVLTGFACYPTSCVDTGTYTFTFGAGSRPTLASTGVGNYNITMGAAPLNLAICITGCANELSGPVTLTNVTGGSTVVPEIQGMLQVTTATGILAPAFASATPSVVDFTINMVGKNSVDFVYTHNGSSSYGPLSSGELIPPVPEPGTWAMVGTGILGLAGLMRRKTHSRL